MNMSRVSIGQDFHEGLVASCNRLVNSRIVSKLLTSAARHCINCHVPIAQRCFFFQLFEEYDSTVAERELYALLMIACMFLSPI